MENKSEAYRVELNLKNRKNLEILGVKKVNSASPKGITLRLNDGSLVVSGCDLNVSRLDLEKEIINIDGRIDGLNFSTLKTKNENFFKKIFK